MQHIRSFRSLARYAALACALFVAMAFASVQALPVSAHTTQSKGSADTTAFIRVVHASPDVGTVDVFVDGAKMLSSFQYATVTGYVPLPAGQHKVQIALIGKGIGASVISQTIAVQAGAMYTVAALGTMASGFSLQVFTDNNMVSGNIAKVRVYHLSPGTGTVNVAASNGTDVTGLSYPQASNYITVTPGSYTLNITPTQVNTPFQVQATLKPWTVTSVFAIGLLNSTPKLQFVAAQVPGVPGLPGTGSDPNPTSAQSASSVTSSVSIAPIDVLLFGLLALAAIGFGVAKRYVSIKK
ncbi:MAG: DUF4397 domain-containing protein [Ktedonobacteraceae bacterium]